MLISIVLFADVIGIRQELDRALVRFRAAMVQYTDSIASATWDTDFPIEAERVFREKVEPAVVAIEEAVYANYGRAWDDAVVQCRDALYRLAAAEKYEYYSELIKHVTAIPWPEGPYTHFGNQLGQLLGQVVMRELDPHEDRPLISALAVAKEENMPSGGFGGLLEGLDIHVGLSWEDRLTFWTAELQRCFETYGKHGAARRS